MTLTHTQSSRLFRAECARIPDHTMHLYARMQTTLYLVRQYGARVGKHSRRIAVALERMDRS
jgi:hypothetical protein